MGVALKKYCVITIMIIIISVALISLLFGIFYNPPIKPKKNKVLIVDDDLDTLYIVKEILTTHNFEVKTHVNGLNVSQIVKQYDPNLILLDMRLPGKSGTEICRELTDEGSTIPIIFLSAYDDPIRSSAECTLSDFIQKPFEIDDFVNRVKFYSP
jgi:DNA-binding response OmpR family regulator